MSICERLEAALASLALDDPAGREVLKALSGSEDCIAAGLKRSADTSDWVRFERYILAAMLHPSRLYTRIACGVLHDRLDVVNNEDVVDLLGRIRDPNSVKCLEEVLAWEPPWDEFGGMAVKCITALDAIGTEEAVVAIKSALHDRRYKVRNGASEILNRRTLT